MSLEVARLCCFIFALIAIILFFLGVPLDMCFEVGGRVACKVALIAPVRFLPGVNEVVLLEIAGLTERLIALWALVRFLPGVNQGVFLQISFMSEGFVALQASVFDPSVNMLVTEKVATRRKCLRTFVTR